MKKGCLERTRKYSRFRLHSSSLLFYPQSLYKEEYFSSLCILHQQSKKPPLPDKTSRSASYHSLFSISQPNRASFPKQDINIAIKPLRNNTSKLSPNHPPPFCCATSTYPSSQISLRYITLYIRLSYEVCFFFTNS